MSFLRNLKKRAIKILGTLKQWNDNTGSALVITLLVMLVLVLLALTLLLQSQTEQAISINEQDSQKSFELAEAGMQQAFRALNNVSRQSWFVNFGGMLAGPDNDPLAVDDNNLIGFDLDGNADSDLITADDIADFVDLTPDPDHDCSDVDDTNIDCVSVKDDLDDDGNLLYEVRMFNVDPTVDGLGNYTSPYRGLLYVRIDDNHDDSPAADAPYVDTDKRIRVTVIAQYPVPVDPATGTITTFVEHATRGTATRMLFADIGPVDQGAISTDGSLSLVGSLGICGACGNVYANEDITFQGSGVVCGDALCQSTLTASPGNVGGLGLGGQPPIEIPVINPFDNRWVPDQNFWQSGMDVPGCPATAYKYYAFISEPTATGGGAGKGVIYKAYWDTVPDPDNWHWYPLDDLNDNRNVMLDDCGMVVDCGGTPGDRDPACVAGIDLLFGAGQSDNVPADPNAVGAANDDGQDGKFYAFDVAGGDDNFDEDCSQGLEIDETLAGSDHNDYTRHDDDPDPGSTGTRSTEIYTDVNGDIAVGDDDVSNVAWQLPGACPPFGTDSEDQGTCGDGPDFKATIKPNEPNGDKWGATGDVYAPMQNAVVFVWGNVGFQGNIGAGTPPVMIMAGGTTQNIPSGSWRTTFLATGHIEVGGTPRYATAKDGFAPLFVGGRDVDLHGTASNDKVGCLSNDPCNTDPASIDTAFAGFVGTHEQYQMSGNIQLDGFVIAEDALNCGEWVNSNAGITTLNGNPTIYYDCKSPPNPFTEGIKIIGWSEQQD